MSEKKVYSYEWGGRLLQVEIGQLAKQAKAEAEQTKVTIRNARQEAMKDLKKLEGVSEDVIKDTESKIQELTDKYVKSSDEHLKVKEADIMKI